MITATRVLKARLLRKTAIVLSGSPARSTTWLTIPP
jgi:hypothetical protein